MDWFRALTGECERSDLVVGEDMMGHAIQKLFAAALVVGALASPAQALPVLTFEFLGSGQVVGPTDEVTVRGRITNSGDPLSAFLGSDSVTLTPEIFNNYVPAFPPFLQGRPPVGPPTFTTELGTGESLDWTIAIFQPFPLTGNFGDPVPLGRYTLPAANIVSFYTIFAPDLVDIPFDTSAAADFFWDVVDDSSALPAPPTLLLMLAGLAILSRYRSRRA